MKKLSNSTVALIVSIIILMLGCIQPARYEAAKKNGYEVDATIVKVVSREETDPEGLDSTVATVYADYEVDGKKYENVRIGRYYDTDSYYVGKTIKVVVNPNRPGSPMREGGVVAVIGFLMMTAVIIHKISAKAKNKKKKNENREK